MKTHLTAFLIILILGGVIYLNSLAASFQWDDIPHIVRNPALYDWRDLGAIFRFWPTRCFLFWTLALNYRFGGLNAAGYHLVNAVIHIFSAFLVYLIFFRLRRKKIVLNSNEDLRDYYTALLAGLLFVAHPLQTQAVTFIVQRGASLSGFCCLLSLYFYARGRQEKVAAYFIAAWISGLLGIFSKEGAAALPLLIGLWELLFGPEEGWRRRLAVWFPFALLPGLILITVWWSVRTGDAGFYYALNLRDSLPSVGLADSADRVSSRWIYIVTQFRVLLIYLRLLFIPVRQTIYYDLHPTVSLFRGAALFPALALASFVALAVRLIRVNRIISFGIFFFLLSLVPTSSLVVLLPLVSEHHLYLALAGFAWAIPVMLGRFCRGRWFGITGALIVFCMALLTYARNLVWLTPLTLWRDALSKAPHLASLHDSMASVYIERGEYGAAVRESRKAFELDPGFNASQNLWAAYHNLGRYDAAAEIARRRIDLFPGSADAHVALALTLIERKEEEAAQGELLRAIALDPDLPRAHLLLGNLYGRAGETKRAEKELRESIRLAPYLMAGYDALGALYLTQGRWGEAEHIYRIALAHNSRHLPARLSLIRIYRIQGREAAARREAAVIEKMIGKQAFDTFMKTVAE